MNFALAISSFVALFVLVLAQPSCAPGTYLIGSRCRPCRKGQFQALTNQTTCEPCPDGLVATSTGSTECVACPELSKPSRRAARCNCERGRAMKDGKCELCDPGTFWQRNYRGPMCEPCGTGTFQTEVGQFECEKCPKGTLSGKGATECITCAHDEYANNRGKCVTCPPGRMHDKYDNKCKKCGTNRYKSGKGLGPCLPCPRGQFSQKGASECIKCPEGTVLLRSGRCLKCPAGSRLNIRKMRCELCPINTYMPYGNVKRSCFKCTGPSFSMEGAKECTRCPRDTKLMQNGTCAECPEGSIYNKELFRCDECGVNEFTRGDMKYCEQCPTGSYSRPGSSTCFTCPKGQAYIAPRDECGTCGRGIEYQSYGGKCMKCYEGSYKPDVGVESCDYCESGKSNKARTACLD